MSDPLKLLLSRATFNSTFSKFSLHDPNAFYDGADIAWMMMASALVLLMIPGIGLFYSGSSEKSSAISMLWMSMMTISVIGLQWWLVGYSIAFTGPNKMWGGSEAIAFHSSLFLPWGDNPNMKIPQLVFALFQGMFACFTGAIISGTVIRTEQPIHFLVFIFIWSTFVYDPIARSTWNPVGWANRWDGKESGVFDFAGGTVVHIVSATTSVVYSMWCKWRRQIFGKTLLTEDQIENEIRRPSQPHNVVNVLLGTTFLYVGWFGFNGGSALGANMRAASACLSTHLAACAGAFTGTALDYWAAYWRGDPGRFSVIGFCNGVLTGLVAITPASGYVPPWSAPIFGFLGSSLCFMAEGYSNKWFDLHHIFVMHGLAGLIGMLLTAAFTRYSEEIAESDGFSKIFYRKEQALLQLADVVGNSLWAAIGTLIILIVMELVILLYRKFRGHDDPGFRSIGDAEIIIKREIRDDVELGRYPIIVGMGAQHPIIANGGPAGGPADIYGAN